jgi:hypothetical protein
MLGLPDATVGAPSVVAVLSLTVWDMLEPALLGLETGLTFVAAPNLFGSRGARAGPRKVLLPVCADEAVDDVPPMLMRPLVAATDRLRAAAELEAVAGRPVLPSVTVLVSAADPLILGRAEGN